MATDKVRRIAEIMAELEELGVDTKLQKSNENVKVVGEGIKEQAVFEDGNVIEIADRGKGFQIYADTTKLDKQRFKRLSRD